MHLEIGLFAFVRRAITFVAVNLGLALVSLWPLPPAIRRHLVARAAHIMLDCLGVRLDVTPSRASRMRPLPQGPSLFVGNHVSYLDVMVMAAAFDTSFLAKAEVGHWPLARSLCRLVAVEFVRRSSLGSRVVALRRLARSLAERSFCVFPEGTTTRQRTPHRHAWHAGPWYAARKAKVDVIAFALAYEDQECLAWVDDDCFIPHLARQLASRPRRATLVWSPIAQEALATQSLRDASLFTYFRVFDLCFEAHNLIGGHTHEDPDHHHQSDRVALPNLGSPARSPLGAFG